MSGGTDRNRLRFMSAVDTCPIGGETDKNLDPETGLSRIRPEPSRNYAHEREGGVRRGRDAAPGSQELARSARAQRGRGAGRSRLALGAGRMRPRIRLALTGARHDPAGAVPATPPVIPVPGGVPFLHAAVTRRRPDATGAYGRGGAPAPPHPGSGGRRSRGRDDAPAARGARTSGR